MQYFIIPFNLVTLSAGDSSFHQFAAGQCVRIILKWKLPLFQGYIHNPAHIPTTGQQYFYLASSEEIDVEVSPEVSTISSELLSWTPQSRQCYMHNERKLAFFSFYTQRNCQIECESNFTLEVCDCIIHYRPRKYNSCVYLRIFF